MLRRIKHAKRGQAKSDYIVPKVEGKQATTFGRSGNSTPDFVRAINPRV